MLTECTGIKNDSFLTVIDEDDDDAVVNVVINIQEGFVRPILNTCELKLTNPSSLDSEEGPIKASFKEPPELPRKPKKPEPAETNGNAQENGKHSLDTDDQPESKGVKRPRPEDDEHPAKKAKLAASSDDDVVVVDDAGGAIVIDDD